jgi:hypothetical protein
MERTLTMEEIVASEAFASYPAEEQRIALLLLEGEREAASGAWMTAEAFFATWEKSLAAMIADEKKRSGVDANAV